jgi:hypothetical protein
MNSTSVSQPEDARTAFIQIHEGMACLRSLGIIRSQKFGADFAEWLIAELFRGRLADNKTQRGWDVLADDKRISVKSHAKAQTNHTRWTDVGNLCLCDRLAIVVMTEDFLVRELYDLPSVDADRMADNKQRLRWDRLCAYRLFPPIDNIPKGLRALFCT